ncbi:MAG: hypothetical protein KC505_06670 [Myxococcales bacterium]|nr:hypothetical protein [Myxococcales bacterium]USN49925.1 MAG: hypothetical protein H6731_06490 [Myxococcales bacterium]
MLKLISLLLAIGFGSILYSQNYQHEIPLFNGGIRLFSINEAKVKIRKLVEKDLFGFEFVFTGIEFSQDTSAQKILEELVVQKGHSFCKRFYCHEKIPCMTVAKRNSELIHFESQYRNSSDYQLDWEIDEEEIFIKKIICSTEAEEINDLIMVEKPLSNSPKVSRSYLGSWFSRSDQGQDISVQSQAISPLRSWWYQASSEPIVPEPSPKVLEKAQQDQSSGESYLTTLWGYSKALVGTFKPAVETFIESKKDADLLDPNTWNLWGQVYELGKIWAVQAAAAGVEAWKKEDNGVEDEREKIYLDDILRMADELVKNERQDLTDSQVSILRNLTNEARLELNKFKEQKSASVNRMLSAVSQAMPNTQSEEKIQEKSPKEQNHAGYSPDPLFAPNVTNYPRHISVSSLKQKFAPPAKSKLTIRQATASTEQLKAAGRPTLLDLKDEIFLNMRFDYLRQILEFPFHKWPIQKEAMRQRREIIEKRGSSEYENKLWALAQNVMDDSNAKESKRTLKYFYAEPGNGKTSGIEEMFTGWLDLPLCKINYSEVSSRNMEKFPAVTGYIRHRIIDCLKTVFMEKSSGVKIRNGVVLLDDFDRVLQGELAANSMEKVKDRENFFLLLKDLGDPSQKTIDAKLEFELRKDLQKVLEFPVRISDLYFFITANSLPVEFEKDSKKSEMINTLLSRIEIYQVPYADRKQRLTMLLEAWKPVEEELNSEAKGVFLINHELCEQSIMAIVEKDGEALDKMNGKMGVRGLIEFFKRFKGTIQTRKLHPDICKLEGNYPSDSPFNIILEAKSIGEYQKEQTTNLRQDAFNNEVGEFLREMEEEISKISESDTALLELQTLKDNTKAIELREQSLAQIQEMITALNPPTPIIMDGDEKQRISKAISEQLYYLGEHNLQNIFDIANAVLKNLTFGGNENYQTPLIFLRQDSATDLGIISNLAEILNIPYCKIDGNIESLAVKTPLIWKKYQTEKKEGTVYLRTSNSNNNIPAAWDEVKKIYTAHHSNKIYIATTPYSGTTYYSLETNDFELSRVTSTDSKWIDLCARQLKKDQLKNLSQVLVLFDRTKMNSFNEELAEAFMESLEGLTRRESGQKIDMRKSSLVIGMNTNNLTDFQMTKIDKYGQEEKSVNINIHPLNTHDRLLFAEAYLKIKLQKRIQELNLRSAPELNLSDRVALQFISYLDLSSYWQTQEKQQKNIVIDPLREMLNHLSSKIIARTTAFLSLEKELKNYTHLFNEYLEKWKIYYNKGHAYSTDAPQAYESYQQKDLEADNWQEVILSWIEKDKEIYFEQKRREEEEKRIAEEKRLAEEQRIAEEKRLAEEQRIAEEKRLAEEEKNKEESNEE